MQGSETGQIDEPLLELELEEELLELEEELLELELEEELLELEEELLELEELDEEPLEFGVLPPQATKAALHNSTANNLIFMIFPHV